MIDVLLERTMPLAQAARRLPRLRGGRRVAPSTLWRWASAGLRGVRLEVVRVGGTCCTSEEALRRFFDATNGVVRGGPAATGAERPAPSEVERRLDAIGICEPR
jgi:hypothetical protein